MQSDVTLEGTSEGIPDDVIDNSEFTLEVDERDYDSESESGSDDGDNPVGGTSEPHPPSSALPRNTSEKVSTETPPPRTLVLLINQLLCCTLSLLIIFHFLLSTMIYPHIRTYVLSSVIINHQLQWNLSIKATPGTQLAVLYRRCP